MMGQVILNGPPECLQGEYCLSCLMDAKQRQWEAYQEEIKAGYAAPADKKTVIAWPPGLTDTLYVGLYRAVAGDYAQLGVVEPLCWTHVAGINPTDTDRPELIPGRALPPGLLKPRR
jgi:hypothetical protein